MCIRDRAYVPVPKDLTKVKTKVMFNLTRRQLVCFTAEMCIRDRAHTAVDDGFLHRLQSVLTAYDQLTQAENCLLYTSHAAITTVSE